MGNRRFWRFVFRVGIYTLIAYLGIGYVVLVSTILRHEIRLLPRTQLVSGPISQEAGPFGTVSTRVHNVFGDPIAYAVVHIDGRITQADSTGHFNLEGLTPDRQTMEIFAGGYQRYKWEIQVEAGMNTPVIKYDTGLWPEFFLVDFHVFHNDDSRLYGIMGFANGSDAPLYIRRATVLDPREQIIQELGQDTLAAFSNISGHLRMEESPQPALRIAPRAYALGDLPPIDGPFLRGTYQLEVHFGTASEHEQSRYRVVRTQDQLDKDNNWNPHLP